MHILILKLIRDYSGAMVAATRSMEITRSDKKNIEFRDIVSTKMSCEDIDFENTFLSLLGRVDRYEVKGNDLVLKRKRENFLF